jgi:serine/threonine protein kinase
VALSRSDGMLGGREAVPMSEVPMQAAGEGDTHPYADTEIANDADFSALMATLGLDATTLILDQRGTIVPTAQLPQTRDEAALAKLRPLILAHAPSVAGASSPSSASSASSEDASKLAADVALGALGALDAEGPVDLRVGKTIGEGGMGLVRVAEQVALGRDVAVKTLREGETRAEATLALLREAWATGSLEHPNIVPIHALGRDARGAPIFVMKRIDGRCWSELLADPTALPADRRTDPLGYHLDVLKSVCNAVAFAHAKRVLHRDLKPDNVMIGAFGEVYVLDWGLAAALPGGDARIPQVADIRSIAGTPHFMAPEMVEADGAAFDERTDVYLLGAILHLILTGRPRHAGRTPMEIIAAAWRSPEIVFDERTPPELAAICNKATAKAPADRYDSVLALQQAITAFQQHRHSLELSRATQSHLATLRGLLALAHPAAAGEGAAAADAAAVDALLAGDTALDPVALPDDSPSIRAGAIANAFSSCRFGFQLALQSWPDNPSAKAGLRDAITLMIDHEIAEGDARIARLLIAELDEVDDAQLARLAALERRLEDDRKVAARRERQVLDMDLRYGTRTRAFVALLIGVIFGAAAFISGFAERAGHMEWSHTRNAVVAGSFVVMIVLVRLWARQTLTATKYNRRVMLSLFALSLLNLLMIVGLGLLGASPRMSNQLQLVVFAVFTATLGAAMDVRLMAASVVYAVAFVAVAIWPRWTLEFFGTAQLLGGIVVAWVWRPTALSGDYDGHTKVVRRKLRETQVDLPDVRDAR